MTLTAGTAKKTNKSNHERIRVVNVTMPLRCDCGKCACDRPGNEAYEETKGKLLMNPTSKKRKSALLQNMVRDKILKAFPHLKRTRCCDS